MRTLCLFVILLTQPSFADLSSLLHWQRQSDPGAYVSSGFHDWRTVSKYRSQPGLHNGYDIAMLAGTEVRAAWRGVVVAITPWYGSEWGVTIASDGFEATYGHISPRLALGQEVTAGTVVGTVVVDHVDVKVRAAHGAYLDFAADPLTVENQSLRPPKVDPEQERRIKTLREELSREQQRLQMGWSSSNKVQALRSQLEGLGASPGTESVLNSWPELARGRWQTDQLILGAGDSR